MFHSVSDRLIAPIYWIASYPRSGNTFTRILLSNYFKSSDSPYPINELYRFIPADTSHELWETLAPDLDDDLRHETQWKRRSLLFQAYRAMGAQRAFPALKTHTANVEVFNTPAFDLSAGDKVIYIVRHPLDVLLSYADYNGRDIDRAIEIMTTSGVLVDQQRLGGIELRGSWPEHVGSWLNSQKCPILLVRYEELCDRTEDCLRDMLTFLGSPIDDAKLRRAVEFSTFSTIRDQEEREGFRERPTTALSGRFFREGRSRQWLRALTPDQAYRLADHCGEVMTKLGYTHPRDVYYDGRNAVGPIAL